MSTIHEKIYATKEYKDAVTAGKNYEKAVKEGLSAKQVWETTRETLRANAGMAMLKTLDDTRSTFYHKNEAISAKMRDIGTTTGDLAENIGEAEMKKIWRTVDDKAWDERLNH